MPFFDPIRIGASGAAEDFTVDRSLRFNDGDSPWLERTVSSSSNRRTFTISVWVKRSTLANANIFGQTDTSGSYMFYMVFDSTHSLYILDYDYPSNNYHFVTNRKFRDTSAWYHIVLAVDTTQATNTERSKLYINGVQETSFSTANYPAQNLQTFVNHTTYPVRIGRNGWSHTNYFDGYMAEYNFIDGQQLTPSSFGETNSDTGQWVPIDTSGLTFGTNGFYLKFADNSGNTATTLGKDSSGNGNNFTPNNFVTGDAVKDSPTNNFCTLNILNSQTTNFSEGNLKAEITNSSGNRTTVATMGSKSGKWYYEVLYNSQTGDALCIGFGDESYNALYGNNKLFEDHSPSIGYGKNNIYNNNSTSSPSTTFTSGDIIGVAADLDNNQIYFYKNGTVNSNTNPLSYTFSDTFFIPAMGNLTSGGNQTFTANFGQDSTFAGAKTAQGNTDANGKGDFYYSVPSGFKALCSANLPDPTILLPNKHFDTLLWTGTAASHTLTGLNFQPDWFWAKARSVAYHNTLMDSVRGTDRQLWSNRSNDEQTNTSFLTSFNSNGVTLGDNSSGTGATNTNGHTYVGWNWNAGDTDGKTYTVTVVSDSGNKFRFDGYGTSAVTLDLAEGGTYIFNYPSGHPFRFSTTSDGTHGGGSEYTTGVTHNSSTQVTIVVAASAPTLYYYCSSHSGMGGQANTNSTLGSSNFDGSIQTTVKANTTAGFSIITYTGNGSTGSTVGHGLGVKPDAIIIKRRNSSSDWMVYHKEVNDGVSPEDYYLSLNNTNTQTNNIIMLNDTAPTSSVVTLYANSAVNSSNDTYVMYCFSEVEGYSKFGSYTGNGNADGTFVFIGFRPAWLLVKRTDDSKSWVLWDNKRDPHNLAANDLYPNRSDAENALSSNEVDFLSNGFKIRNSASTINGSSGTFIYLAFAESPFKNARAR